jgi:hypothetical protein
VKVRILPIVLAVLLTSSGCGWIKGLFGDDDKTKGDSVSVFDVQIGQCFTAQTDVRVELSELNAIACDQPHQQEAYAKIDYVAPNGGDSSIYPGDSALAAFAKGACAESFTDYVGVSYLDSRLFFTYLLPSARGWEQEEDRTVLCFITATDRQLTQSVKGSKL